MKAKGRILSAARYVVGGLFVMAMVVCGETTGAEVSPEAYDIVWDSPSEDHRGSMPLGNGEIALNTWVEPTGDLLFYIARSDAWGDNGRLLKVGRVRVRVEPSLWQEGMRFEQKLSLGDGTMVVRCGEGDGLSTIRLWVDAKRPVVHVSVDTAQASTATACIELWRTERYELPSLTVSDVYLHRGNPGNKHAPTFVEPDTLLTDLKGAVGWYHHNTKSVGPELTMELQGLGDFEMTDPLLNRIFGAVITTQSGKRLDDLRLQSGEKTHHAFRVTVLTMHPATPEQWLEAALEADREAGAVPDAEGRAAHEAHWRAFWERSWIDVTSREQGGITNVIPDNQYPLRIGFDQHGKNVFRGEIGRASVWTRVLSGSEIAALAQGGREVLSDDAGGQVGSWAVTPGTSLDVSQADLTGAMTLEAWVKPEKMPASGGRIFDKVTPGGGDGFLFDTYPGNSLRFIVGREIMLARDILTPDQWHHVAAVVDHAGGGFAVFHNGKRVSGVALEAGDDAFVVSRAYALQRFMDACAGGGPYPIKFNGSLFTVAAAGAPGDADYRRWGPGYWWQNTRLPYLSMCASGDPELMLPLFNMYGRDLMPLFSYRTKAYFGHGGAYIPECIYFWGTVFSESYGWQPAAEREDKLQVSGYHKWEWVSGPELVWMMLDYYEHTLDEGFLVERLLPAAHEILTFFNEHYETDGDGDLVMHPAQALETWWNCTNPMPEVAGLYGCTERLLQLPERLTTPAQRGFWRALREKLPPLPTRNVEGKEMLAPATVFKLKHNCENPELYAVFPFRQIALGRPRIELGLEALKHRWDRGHFGWRQDDIFMAYLGLAEEARAGLVERARKRDGQSRFPAFWGPNYDWVPDQDHGGVLMKTLQSMILQADGDRLYVLPAWPEAWDVRFKLHAPKRTVVQGRYEKGTLAELNVTPEARRADVILGAQGVER